MRDAPPRGDASSAAGKVQPPDAAPARGRPGGFARVWLAAGLTALAAPVAWVPVPPPGWVLQMVLASALVLAGLVALAWSWLPMDQAASVAAVAYAVTGLLLATAEVAYIGVAWRGGLSLLALAAWPSLLLFELGRWLGVVPLPE